MQMISINPVGDRSWTVEFSGMQGSPQGLCAKKRLKGQIMILRRRGLAALSVPKVTVEYSSDIKRLAEPKMITA
jgi:hypothetical protein